MHSAEQSRSIQLFIPVTVVLLGLIPSVAVGELVLWPVGEGGNGHYYEVIQAPSGITWDDANAQAAAMGRHLATITWEEENDFVFALVDHPEFWSAISGNFGPWLGGFQFPDSGGPNDDWTWVTGEPWDYTNWGADQPNDHLGWTEDKLHFYEPSPARSPTWNDISNNDPGGRPIAFVTEVPEPATLSLLAIGCLALPRRRC